MATLDVTAVTKSFGATKVLHGVDLHVADGEMIVIVGASGCGKSTLLRIVAGLETATTGSIRIAGREVTALEPSDRDIAMVFQNYALYPHMTVAENMAYGLKIRGLPRPEIARRVAEAAGLLGIEALLDRRPRQLSGGQRQRVAMGRAIVRHPQVFLFDEPLSNLDAKLRVQMRGEIKDLHQRLRTTTVYVTHDQIEAMTMADQIVVMQAGRVEQIGTPLELYDRPANLFVAGFIGSPAMNFLPGHVDGGGFRPDGLDGTAASLPLPTRAGDGEPVVYGIRPEHLRLDEAGIPVTVQLVEPTGSETMVTARLGASTLVGAFRERIAARVGDTLRVMPDPALAHLFSKGTGLRLGA